MSSVQPQRKFINQQLTPAEETDPEFEEVIVKSEDELDDQSSLLDFSQEGIKMSNANVISLLNFEICVRFIFWILTQKAGELMKLPRDQHPTWLRAK